MLINTEGKPALLSPVIQNEIDEALWQHCFANGAILDNRKNRAIVSAMLKAHGVPHDFCHDIGKKGK